MASIIHQSLNAGAAFFRDSGPAKKPAGGALSAKQFLAKKDHRGPMMIDVSEVGSDAYSARHVIKRLSNHRFLSQSTMNGDRHGIKRPSIPTFVSGVNWHPMTLRALSVSQAFEPSFLESAGIP